MKKTKILFLFYIFFIISSCGTVKEGFKNPKKDNSDEFLVEKKSPLVMPPDYNELPFPKNTNVLDVKVDEDFKDLIFDEKKETFIDSDKEVNLEKSLLEQIKKQ